MEVSRKVRITVHVALCRYTYHLTLWTIYNNNKNSARPNIEHDLTSLLLQEHITTAAKTALHNSTLFPQLPNEE